MFYKCFCHWTRQAHQTRWQMNRFSSFIPNPFLTSRGYFKMTGLVLKFVRFDSCLVFFFDKEMTKFRQNKHLTTQWRWNISWMFDHNGYISEHTIRVSILRVVTYICVFFSRGCGQELISRSILNFLDWLEYVMHKPQRVLAYSLSTLSLVTILGVLFEG